MEMTFKQLKETLLKLNQMQEDHIDCFDTQLLPDLEQQMVQRREKFTELKQHLSDLFLKTEGMETATKRQLLQEIQEHILSLMHRNKTLKSKVQKHKDELEKSMKNITQGKRVFHAYGASVSQRTRPRVINCRN